MREATFHIARNKLGHSFISAGLCGMWEGKILLTSWCQAFYEFNLILESARISFPTCLKVRHIFKGSISYLYITVLRPS